jgi:hypothetical protein
LFLGEWALGCCCFGALQQTLQDVQAGHMCSHGSSHTCDHAEVRLGLKRVQHLDDVFMPELPQDFNLLPQVPDVLF